MKIHHGETLTLTAAAVDDGGADVVQVSVGSSWPTDASLATAAAAIAAAVF